MESIYRYWQNTQRLQELEDAIGDINDFITEEKYFEGRKSEWRTLYNKDKHIMAWYEIYEIMETGAMSSTDNRVAIRYMRTKGPE